jgi:hypothetical protein
MAAIVTHRRVGATRARYKLLVAVSEDGEFGKRLG